MTKSKLKEFIMKETFKALTEHIWGGDRRPFITDSGKGYKLGNDMYIPRYGVWVYGSGGRNKHEVAETSDDLEMLKKKYNVTDEDVFPMQQAGLKEQAFGFEEIEESEASEEAKKLNLVHLGFGNYAQKVGGVITHKTIDGKLVNVGGREPAKDPAILKKTAEEPPEQSVVNLEDPDSAAKKVIIQKSGVTDVQLIDEDEQIYSFRYNGKLGRIKLSKEEREQLEIENIVHIIEARIERKIARLKAKKARQAPEKSAMSKEIPAKGS